MFRDALHSSPEDATLKLSTMRLLDAWAGRPICRALTLVRRFADRVLTLSPVSLGSLFASRRGPSLTLVTSSTSRAAGA